MEGLVQKGWIGLVGVMSRTSWMSLLGGMGWIAGKGMSWVSGSDRWDSLDWAGRWDRWDSLEGCGGGNGWEGRGGVVETAALQTLYILNNCLRRKSAYCELNCIFCILHATL